MVKIKKFSQVPVNFVFTDENTGQEYRINNLNCTQDQFFEWLENYNYDDLESKYGIHDFSGTESSKEIQVGFTSYEISKKDFITVMEIWRKALLDAGFITEDQQVEVIGDDNNPIICVYNPLMEYEERFLVERMDKEQFEEDYLEDFTNFVEEELCKDEYGIYEFDGDIDGEYLIQTNDEEEDWEENFEKIVNKIIDFFANQNIDITKI